MATPLHALTGLKQLFKWGGKQQKSFDTLKQKNVTAQILALSDLQQPFKIENDASKYVMGAILLQKGKPICFHSKEFSKAVANYPNYNKELYALMESVKKWKHYLMGKKKYSYRSSTITIPSISN